MLIDAARFPGPAFFQGIALILLVAVMVARVILDRREERKRHREESEKLAADFEYVKKHFSMVMEREKQALKNILEP